MFFPFFQAISILYLDRILTLSHEVTHQYTTMQESTFSAVHTWQVWLFTKHNKLCR